MNRIINSVQLIFYLVEKLFVLEKNNLLLHPRFTKLNILLFLLRLTLVHGKEVLREEEILYIIKMYVRLACKPHYSTPFVTVIYANQTTESEWIIHNKNISLISQSFFLSILKRFNSLSVFIHNSIPYLKDVHYIIMTQVIYEKEFHWSYLFSHKLQAYLCICRCESLWKQW